MKLNQIKALLLALLMLGALALTACGEQGGQTPSEDAPAASGCQVKVTDAFGEPVSSGVIVRFMQNGEQVSMQPVGEDGTATKELEEGTYDVELKFTDDEAAYYYDQTGLTVTANGPALEVTLYNALSGEPASVHAYSLLTQGTKDHQAYHVAVGGTYVELIPGERNYFLFTPTQAGTYEISVQGDATVGSYGSPYFVQEFSTVEPVDNVITESVRDSMIGTNGTGTTVMVLGLDAAESVTSAILTIRRTGDPAWSVEDEPWHVYEPTITLTAYEKPEGTTLKEFDLTASTDTYALVLDAEGYYHLGSQDGPMVVVRLGAKSGGSKYLADFETILERSGVSKYFYDENGEFVKKESYSECLLEYIQYMDAETGLFPLTEDLKYIIQMRGDHYGWFDQSSPGYIFYDQNRNPVPGINHDISWLFCCGYLEG